MDGAPNNDPIKRTRSYQAVLMFWKKSDDLQNLMHVIQHEAL